MTSSRFISRAEGKGSRTKVIVPEASVVIIIGMFARRGKEKGKKHQRLVISNSTLWICLTSYLRGEFYDKILLSAISFAPPFFFFCISFINLCQICLAETHKRYFKIQISNSKC